MKERLYKGATGRVEGKRREKEDVERERKEPRGSREEEEEKLRKGEASNREEGGGGAKRVS